MCARTAIACSVLFILAGCGDDEGLTAAPDAAVADAAASDAPPLQAAGCNPIVGEDCLTPFPSSHFLESAATATGVRVHIPAELMPVSTTAIRIRPDRLNGKDGFSPSTPLLVHLAAGVDATQLPRLADLAASTAASSAVQILEWESGARVPLFAELDANADPATQRQALIIRAQERLAPGTRYIVALVGMRDRAGAPLAPAPFRALRDRTTLPAAVAGLAARYDEIFARLEAAGVPRGSVSLAWDVTTSSDATSTGNLVKMRDEALAMAAAGQLGYRVVSSEDTPADTYRMREVKLILEAPRYLASDDPAAFLRFGADGRPVADGKHEFAVTVEIPRCAATATAPLPVVIYGHGLFGTAANNLESELLQKAGDDLCMVLVGNDWLGLSTDDLPTVIASVLPDLNKIWIITDRLQQAHVNAQVMARLVKTVIKDDPAMKLGDRAFVDGSEIYYFGISNGGIQGAAFLALSLDVNRAVLNVPGSQWSLMIFRSTQFNPLYPFLAIAFPDPLDRQLLVAASQSEWDHTDPATFAPHILGDPLPGTSDDKQVILQESVGDAQVPNMSTRLLARAIGLKGFGLVQRVHGIEEVAGPLPSAYTQWDTHKTPLPPDTNVPAAADNGAHDAVYKLPAAGEQIRRFFRPDGSAENTCNGACDFP